MKRSIYITGGILILNIVLSCNKTDQSENVPIIVSPYLGINYVAPVYSEFHKITGSNQAYSLGDVYQDQSFCTDEAVWPVRSHDSYYDDFYGRFKRLFTHNWNSSLFDLNTLWKFSYNIIDLSNKNISTINSLYPNQKEVTAPVIGELEVLRSFAYYYLIDFFGNVPIITKYDSTHAPVSNEVNFNTGRQMLFDTIVTTIERNMQYLPAYVNDTAADYLSTWAAYALLAKMYINSEVWTGTPKYDECIAACNQIINSGLFNISADYFSNFLQSNESSRENIFVIPYNQNSDELNEGFYFMSLHYNSNLTYNTVGAPWNGFCALPDHYHSFDSTDVRRKGWEVGPQFAADGITPIMCFASGSLVGHKLIFTADFINPYKENDTNRYNYNYTLEVSGARLVKYEIAWGLPHICQGVPLAVFRYADILMLKAEALMRKNGGVATDEAVTLVNQIRSRAGVIPFTTSTLTLDELLAERGREFYYEGIRRQDLVRFNKFVRGTWGRNFSGPYQEQWYDRSGEGDYRNVFPIPIPILQVTGLYQNPGY